MLFHRYFTSLATLFIAGRMHCIFLYGGAISTDLIFRVSLIYGSGTHASFRDEGSFAFNTSERRVWEGIPPSANSHIHWGSGTSHHKWWAEEVIAWQGFSSLLPLLLFGERREIFLLRFFEVHVGGDTSLYS